jgi:hypothetical protein
MLTIWHTQKVPYMCALDCTNMAQIACKIGYFVSVNHFQLRHRQRTPSTKFFWTKLSLYHIHTNYCRIEHSEMILGPFKKMTFGGQDPLVSVKHLCQKVRVAHTGRTG